MPNYSTVKESWPKQDRPLYRYWLDIDGTISYTEMYNYEAAKDRQNRTEYRFAHKNAVHVVKEADLDKVKKNHITSFTRSPEWAKEMFKNDQQAKYDAAMEALKKSRCLMAAIDTKLIVRKEHK